VLLAETPQPLVPGVSNVLGVLLQQSPPLLHPPDEGVSVTIGSNGSTGGNSW